MMTTDGRIGRVRGRVSATGLALAALSMVGTSAVAAQQARPAAAASQGMLEEVVVTARKREESLQDVGQSVSAFSASEIENRFAEDISQITDISPNLVIDDTAQGPGGVAAISLRGIGVAEVESSFDPAVGVVIDGLFLGKASGSITKLIDIERIEVLRGPQGTLFGRNSIGGVINITRAKPTGEFSGKVRGSYGSYDNTELDGMLNFGIGEQLAVKLTASRHEQGDGYYDNLTTGGTDGDIQYTMYGAHLLFTPRPDLDIEYSYTREEYDQDTPPLLNVSQSDQLFCSAFGYCAVDIDTPSSADRYKVTQNGPNDATFDADTHIASVAWDMNDEYRIDYIFGYRETDEEVLQDFDATPETLFETTRPEEYDQTSHELRLTRSGERLDFVVGAYLFDMEYTIDLVSFIGFVVPNTVLNIPQTANQKTDSWALFFESDYNLTDSLVFTVGGRYSDDEKQAQITNDFFISQPTPVKQSWSEFTPKVGLKWFVEDELMFYGLYSTGYRAGGFNGRPTTQEAADLPYDPETVDNYEIGVKSQWLDNRLRLNAALFRMTYDDKQEEQSVAVASGTGQQTVVANASSATIWGAEVDFAYLPQIEGLELSGNVGWLDADYDDFVADIGRGGVTQNDDLEFRRAPEFTASLAVRYEWTVGPGTAWARAGWHFIDEHATSLANSPQTNNDEQHLIDASLNYDWGNTVLSVFGRNLADEDGYTIGFDVGGVAPPGSLWTYAAPRAPRTFGVQLSHDF
ncbi:MAG: TonB-dependent receptor [Pseudomonadales bacterium]